MKRPIAYIAGTGRGTPATVMTNYDFAAIGIETTDEWIVERTGIKQRHIAKTESVTDLASAASRIAMQRAGVQPLGSLPELTCTHLPGCVVVGPAQPSAERRTTAEAMPNGSG